ncbi:MAG: DUF1622 domain-containing protein [Blautia sp.]|nr:DUF1622 domain-containing protein [Blautia sp.]
MVEVLEILEGILHYIVNVAIILFEFIGVGVIIYTGIKSFAKWLLRDAETGIFLAKGLAMGLEFKMGSEILRTVVVRDWQEIATVAGIIALRASLAFLLHWEIKQEQKHSADEKH